MKPILKLVFVIALSLCGWTAQATSSQSGGQAQFTAEEIAAFAKKVETTLAQKGAKVFLLARVGRPPESLPRGVEYTHVGFGVYSAIKTADGRTLPGYAMYNLYQRTEEPNRSDLVTDFPVDFFASVFALEAGVIVPTPAMQERLLKVIASKSYRKLHDPRYSVLASPYTTGYQNCTEHTLDVINAAVYETDDIAVLKANARAYFDAQTIELNPLKLMLGSIFMPDVALSDHNGRVTTATFPAIGKYMQKYGLAQEQFVITAN